MEPHEHGLAPGALDAAEFQRAVLAALSSVQGLSAEADAPFRIRVITGHRPALFVRLDGMAKAHRHGELSVEAAAAEIAIAAGAAGADELARDAGVSLAQPAGPFPKLMRRAALPPLPPQAVLRPCDFDPDLVIGYVRTLPHGQLPVTLAEAAERWPAIDDLHSEALANLHATSEGVELQGIGWGPNVALGYATGDGHDAARALVPELLAAAGALVDGEALVALPCRDLLLLVGSTDADFLEEARRHVREVFAADPQPLSDRLYAVRDGHLTALD